MFFQSIYQMITAGTDLNINIRKVDNSLSVAVMPRRNSLKEDTRQNMVPLVVNGTPAELDMGFLQTILQPIQKVQGLLVNAENFEKQAEKATAQAKSSKAPTVPAESKEAREKREKMEKLLKKADDATAAKRFSEAMTWLKQARVLAPSEKQKEIDEKMQEVQKQASEGGLFGMAEEPAPVIPQPQGSINGQPQPGMQTSIFPEQQTHIMNPEPVMQSAPQQIPQGMPQPVYGMNGAYIQPAPNRPVMQGTGMPQGATMQPYPQQPAYQPETAPYPQQQVRQPTNDHIPNRTAQVQNGNGREYQTAPAAHDTFCFDPEDENDRELLREDPYAEYPDFPAEYRMKDEAQVEMVYC